MPQFVAAAKTSEIAPGTAKGVDVHGKRIALFNLGGEFFAIGDECTHSGGPLCEGMIEGQEVECPWHGARFNIKSGAALTPPAFEGVARYNVRVSGDSVEVEV